MTTEIIVLDTWPLMAFFEDQKAAGRVEDILLEAAVSERRLLMSVVNAGELWYCTARAYTKGKADSVLKELPALGIETINADWTITRLAASYKTRGKIAYADCFAAALTKLHDASLVTGDPELKILQKEIDIVWLG